MVRVRPSALNRIVNCSYSLRANDGCDDESNDAALEGTTAHWGSYEELNGRNVVGEKCPETDMIYTQKMSDDCSLYRDYIERMRNHGSVQLEQCITCPDIHPNCEGTPDAAAWIPKANTLVIVDLKYGWRLVHPYENFQLTAYASGHIAASQLPHNTNVILAIVQPRPNHQLGKVREWHTTVGELRATINYISSQVHEAFGVEPHAKTGSYCAHCPQAGTCSALSEASYNAIDYVERFPENIYYDAGNVSAALDNLERAKDILRIKLKAIEEIAEQKIRAGESLPNYELGPTFARSKKWLKDEQDLIEFGKIMGVKLTKEKLLTPSEAVKAGLPKRTVDQLSEAEKTGLKLMRVNHDVAKMAFQKKVNI